MFEDADFWLANTAMSLIAVDHWNSRDGSVTPSIAEFNACPVRLNATMVDTGYTAPNVMSQYVRRYR